MARHTRNSTLTPWIVTALATALTGAAGCTPDAASAGETRTPAPGAAGIGDKLHPGLGNGGYTVRHTANEGHAVYYQSLWDQVKGGSEPADGMKRRYQDSAAQLRKQGPVANPRPGAFTPEDMAPYGWGAYQGGAVALYALRQKVGAATFQRIERAWVAEHRDSTAGTADFIRLASRVAGRDLGPFLRSWLYAEKLPAMPGHSDWHTS
ncbi:hypothetical protein [Streptomyces iranensis]|nr:hypothetical protein [Streptomyces iranensis]MBP2059921.1 hypothetical protein [Streptomyces iranensis]